MSFYPVEIISMRKIRIILAAVFLIGIMWLFLDFTGTAHAWLGWMAKLQFLPAVLALNAGVMIGLVAITLVLGDLSVGHPAGCVRLVWKESQEESLYILEG